jgi:hypothetical protein
MRNSDGNPLNDSKIVNEDYFRVLKNYKEVSEKKCRSCVNTARKRDTSLVELASPGEEEDLDISRETMNLIDKVVLARTKQGKFGAEHSELIHLEM